MSGKRAKKERSQRRDTEGTRVYWHGGPDGFEVGSIILPVTTLLRLPANTRANHAWFDDLRHDRVYATTDRILARDFAAKWSVHEQRALTRSLTADGQTPPHNPWASVPRDKGGSLYRVALIGAVHHDPDYPEGVSYAAGRARVIAVEETGIPYSTVPSPESLHYQRWDTGERIYGDDGYALASKHFQAFGVTDEDLRPLGYAPDLDRLLQHVNTLALQTPLGKRLAEQQRKQAGAAATWQDQ